MKLVYVCVIVIVQQASCTLVYQCNGGNAIADGDVQLADCVKGPCMLKKKTEVEVKIKFKPEFDVDLLWTRVFATLNGVPLPFAGVDSTSACQYVYKGGEKVGCPLKAGEEYEYKNVISVLSIFPQVNIEVEWGLSHIGRNVYCFKVPAKIVN